MVDLGFQNEVSGFTKWSAQSWLKTKNGPQIAFCQHFKAILTSCITWKTHSSTTKKGVALATFEKFGVQLNASSAKISGGLLKFHNVYGCSLTPQDSPLETHTKLY